MRGLVGREQVIRAEKAEKGNAPGHAVRVRGLHSQNLNPRRSMSLSLFFP